MANNSILHELARAKTAFQLRAIEAVICAPAHGSKHDQNMQETPMITPDTDTLAGLLDCPFCGEHPGGITDATRILGVFHITHRCKVIGPIKVESIARDFLVSTWNTRAQAAKDKARIERLEAALRKMNVGDGWAARIARAALEDGE